MRPKRKDKEVAERIDRIRQVFAEARRSSKPAEVVRTPVRRSQQGWNNVEAYMAVIPPFDQFEQFDPGEDQDGDS